VAPVTLGGIETINQNGQRDFSNTIFQAALDAAGNKAWPHPSFHAPPIARFPTQARYLKATKILFGIDSASPIFHREAVSLFFEIPGQALCDCAARVAHAPGYHECGKAICNILDAIGSCAPLHEMIMEAGAGAGLWPRPRSGDGTFRFQGRSPFRANRIRGRPENKIGGVNTNDFV
jgi:hypothetical protein